MKYTPTIGLEIHAELKTITKMFCRCKNDAFSAEPNTNVCPVCLAHPGALPVINGEAVRQVLRVGLALGGQLADYTEFDRKNYFYPDQPKGYQLSQYEYPLVSGGSLSGVEVTRVHLEEDTASSIHEEGVGTVVDYNRSGVPLMELVTEPVISSSKQAGGFARELQLLLRYLTASDANMEKGEMRVEANISVSKDGMRGTKVEVKNLNSFRAMERAIEYEVRRQGEVLERGELVVQETRGWDEGKQATFAQRLKEGSADYRYFPDPDLPSLKLSELPECRPFLLRETMPELPSERRARYLNLGVRRQDADTFVNTKDIGDFFDQVIAGGEGNSDWVVSVSKLVANDLTSLIRDYSIRDTESSAEISITALRFKSIAQMLYEGRISSSAAKSLIRECYGSDIDPEVRVNESELMRSESPIVLDALIKEVVAANQQVVMDYKSGKVQALQYLIGQIMKVTKGASDPLTIRELTVKFIDEVRP